MRRSTFTSALVEDPAGVPLGVGSDAPVVGIGGVGRPRLHELPDRTYSRFAEYEPHMRAALQPALEHCSLETAGTGRETEAVVRWMLDALVHAALREAREPQNLTGGTT